MSPSNILIQNSLSDLGSAAVDVFLTIASGSISARGTFTVSLAGGSTPRAMYSMLGSSEFRSEIDWSAVEFFFGDERNVPQDSPDSNYKMVSETLLKPLRIKDEKIHPWRTKLDDPAKIAEDYEALLLSRFRRRHDRFDLVLLGLGADAHTASLFPHTAALHESKRYAVPNFVPQLDAFRLTTTFRLINQAANVVFLVAGEEKADAVKHVLTGDQDFDEYPAQNVKPENGELFWLLDRASAGGLEKI